MVELLKEKSLKKFRDNDFYALKNISIELNKGDVLAIVGPSGAGKSTLTDLVLRFYDPKKGNIYIDDINLKELNINEYRKMFGVVPQESLLFNDSIFNNIKFGRNYDYDIVIKKKYAKKLGKKVKQKS